MATRSSYDSIPPEHTNVYIGAPGRPLFDSKNIRAQFVSKVYSIVFVQLLVTSILIAWFSLDEATKTYMLQNSPYYIWPTFAVFTITFFVLVCVETARRSYPLNFALLVLLTLSLGLLVAVASSIYDKGAVLSAFAATAFATLVLILLAKYSSYDITTCGCTICILAFVHMFAATIMIIAIPAYYASTGQLLIAATGAFLVSLYLMFDLQLIMGGRSLELSPEEYILGAVMLYVDITRLFQYLLFMFGERR